MSERATHPGVVVGVDGSRSSTMAVRWAVREASMRNVGLTVVHVLTPRAVWPAAPIPAELYRRHEEGAREVIADAIKAAEDSVQEGNRPEQGPLQGILPAAANHHHVRLFGHADEGRHGRGKQQFTVDLRAAAVLHAIFGDLDRIGDDRTGALFVPPVQLSRDRRGGPDG